MQQFCSGFKAYLQITFTAQLLKPPQFQILNT